MSVNGQQIKELANQLRGASDCESLALLLPNYTHAVSNLTKSINKTKQDQLAKILPIMKIPGANPLKIVKWVKKSVLGQALPQLQAYIKYAQDLIQIAKAVEDIVSAVASIDEKIKGCAIVIQNNNPITQIQDQINLEINSTLYAIDSIQTSISTITAVPGQIDTSSLEGFVNTVDTGLSNIQGNVNSIVNSKPIQIVSNPSVYGNTVVGNILSASNGQWAGVDTFTYQWSRVKDGVKVDLYNATDSTYTTTTADIGSQIFVSVTGENPGEAEFADSAAVTIIV